MRMQAPDLQVGVKWAGAASVLANSLEAGHRRCARRKCDRRSLLSSLANYVLRGSCLA